MRKGTFKNVTVQLPEDVWKHPDVGGASQPAAQGEAHLVVFEATWRIASWTPRSMNSMLLQSNKNSKKGMPAVEQESRTESIPGGVGTCKS